MLLAAGAMYSQSTGGLRYDIGLHGQVVASSQQHASTAVVRPNHQFVAASRETPILYPARINVP